MKPGVPARAAARKAVSRVLRSGAYSNLVVHGETRELPPRDAHLAQRLAYDTLRNLLRVDRTIQSASTRPLGKIQDDVLDTLRVGVNEVLFARSKDHAVVDSTVEVVRLIRPGAAGFCNAIMRAVVRDGEPPLPSTSSGPTVTRARRYAWVSPGGSGTSSSMPGAAVRRKHFWKPPSVTPRGPSASGRVNRPQIWLPWPESRVRTRCRPPARSSTPWRFRMAPP